MTYIAVFFVALVISIAATPLSIVLAKKWGAIDYPGARRVHKKPIPRLGGIAIYAAFWLTAAFTQTWDETLWGLLFGSTIILGVGIWDDTRGMRPLAKLLWQVLAAGILLLFDFSIDQITLPLVGHPINLGSMGLVLLIFWVVGLVNTVNIADGLDGLAAGICFGAALLLFWSANQINQVHAAYWTLSLAGACLGFLFFNSHPARVFMGDTGSMFLGYIIGGISIAGLLKTATILGLVFPLLVLGLPLTDLTFAIIRRKLRGRPIAVADRGHLHHRLLDAGLTQRQAVLVMYAISACFGLTAILGASGYWLGAVVLLLADFSLLVSILLRRNVFLSVLGRRHSK